MADMVRLDLSVDHGLIPARRGPEGSENTHSGRLALPRNVLDERVCTRFLREAKEWWGHFARKSSLIVSLSCAAPQQAREAPHKTQAAS